MAVGASNFFHDDIFPAHVQGGQGQIDTGDVEKRNHVQVDILSCQSHGQAGLQIAHDYVFMGTGAAPRG